MLSLDIQRKQPITTGVEHKVNNKSSTLSLLLTISIARMLSPTNGIVSKSNLTENEKKKNEIMFELEIRNDHPVQVKRRYSVIVKIEEKDIASFIVAIDNSKFKEKRKS